MAGDSSIEYRYRGPLKAVILDWAGTTVDYGSCAPAGVFVEVFQRRGVAITLEQARGPMGIQKRDHIAAILKMPSVDALWRAKHGRAATDDDVDAMYSDLIPRTIEVLPQYADLIPGTLEAVAAFRQRGLKIGTTTGYSRAMMDVLLVEAKRRGFEPDCSVTGDDVAAGRPFPWMCWHAAMLLDAYPAEAVVKVGDTVPDIDEGRNAGMWTVAVAKTGNELGLPERELAALPPDVLEEKLAAARERLSAAGAHYVVDGIADVPPLLDQIVARLKRDG